MASSNHVLIINYDFPPTGGIGGRRWAKFAKFFFNNKVDFSVITFENNADLSPWQSDIVPFKDRIVQVNSQYPKIVNTVPKTLIEKIRYKATIQILKWRTKGNYYDKSALDESVVIDQIEKTIREKNVTDIVVSVAPFKLSYFISKIIPKYPDIKFIVDFRDPWTTNETSYGFKYLSKKQKAEEKELELNVIKNFHKVVSVAPEMTNYFKSLDPNSPEKFYTIINGFDAEDFIEAEQDFAEDKYLNLVFTGTFYNNTEYLMREFETALSQIREESPEIFRKVKFNFYGAKSKVISELAKTYDCIIDHAIIPKAEIKNVIASANAGLLFLSEDITYSFSTKFCEYLALKKPIVVFSKEGITSGYIEENGIGYAVLPGQIKEKIISIYNDWDNGEALPFSTSFDLNQFNTSTLATQYINLINS